MTSPRPSPFHAGGSPFPGGATEVLADFLRRHSAWADRFRGDEPVYALDDAAITTLARPTGARSEPFFDRSTAAAEREYARLCASKRAAGFGTNGFIAYHLLTALPLDIADPNFAKIGASATALRAVQELADRGAESRRRLLGVVGWLLTEPAFLAQVEDVRRRYEDLPPDVRPQFPLGRVLSVRDRPERVAESAFPVALRALLDRWGLVTLAAWDLPDPQGPLLPDPLPADSSARPAHGVYVYVPAHYPLQGDDDLQRRVAEFQRRRVADLGIDQSFAGNTHHETYGRMFRVLHLEQAVRRRFARPPRGLVGSIVVAAADAFGLGTDRVQRLRKWINTCRTGNRSRVKDLRVAV